MTLFQALIMRAAEICTLCPMKTIRLINGWTCFSLPSIPAISFLGPFSARWTDSFSLSWQAFTSFYKIRPAANSDWLDRSVQFKCPQRKRGCTVIRRGKKKKAKKKKSLPAERFTQGNCTLSSFPRYHHVRNYRECAENDVSSNFCMLAASEKQEYLPRGGVIYHGKYVRRRPVKAWWFRSSVTSDVWLYAGRGLIKATSITQPDNRRSPGKKTNDGS